MKAAREVEKAKALSGRKDKKGPNGKKLRRLSRNAGRIHFIVNIR